MVPITILEKKLAIVRVLLVDCGFEKTERSCGETVIMFFTLF